MPKVKLPTTFKGWLVTIGGSIVGFVSGTAFLAWASKRFQ